MPERKRFFALKPSLRNEKRHLLWLRLMGTELKKVRQKSKAMTLMQKKATRKEKWVRLAMKMQMVFDFVKFTPKKKRSWPKKRAITRERRICEGSFLSFFNQQ